MVAPAETGDYEIRFFNEKHGGLLARHAINVTPSKIILDVPSDIQKGTSFKVNVNGLNAPGDFIFLVPAETENELIPTDISYRYSLSDQPIEMIAPFQSGSYDIRYFSLSNGVVIVNKSFDVH